MRNQLSVLDVAKYILERTGSPISTMKLQKLTFYCQAWHVTWANKPLFNETFAAWANGPVCRDLYVQHRGKYSISADGLTTGIATKLSSEQKFLVDAVLDAYLPLSGVELSELTHRENPWKDARGQLSPTARSEALITTSAMQAYYGQLADDPEAKMVKDMERPAWA